MCKLTENCFRDVNIAFANELSMLCDSMDVDVWRLIELANRHPRVKILRPGAGVGGHCIAVDPWFIVSEYPEKSRLIRAARVVNDSKPAWVHEQVTDVIRRLCSSKGLQSARGVTVGCFGLAFKPDIDDLRESPAVEVVKMIAAAHSGSVKVAEPYIDELPGSLSGLVELVPADDLHQVADVLVFLVAHSSFHRIKLHAEAVAYTVDACGLLAAQA
jgi:UDP-N-acetyl-D-mannosaminuronic acid dehydrogenase